MCYLATRLQYTKHKAGCGDFMFCFVMHLNTYTLSSQKREKVEKEQQLENQIFKSICGSSLPVSVQINYINAFENLDWI